MTIVPAPDVLAAHLSGEAVLLDLRDKNYYRLNETAAAVWKGLEEGCSRKHIIDRLVSDYDVAEATAEAAVDRVLGEFESKGLVDVQRPA